MNKTPTYILMLLLLAFGFKGRAQLVNKGVLYVSEGEQFSAAVPFDNQEDGAFFNNGRTYFYKDFNNDGVYDFYDGGENWFIGEDPQTLSGTEPVYVYDVLFDHAQTDNAFQLAADIEVEHQADFQQGIINSRGHGGSLIFAEEANHKNTSDKAHVEGAVQKIGDTGFVFPIGAHGYYRQAEIAEHAEPHVFQAAYYRKNPNMDYPLEHKETSIKQINNREYWALERLESGGAEQIISLSYNPKTTPQNFITAAEQNALVIVRWDETDKQWKNEGGNINVDENKITATIEEAGVFTLATTERWADCSIEVFNVVDLAGANKNKFMRIESECADIQKVRVFNRWGVQVFETDHYGQDGDVFDGYSSGRLTLSRGSHLPTDHYFYIIDYVYTDGAEQNIEQKVGYVYVQSD